MWTLQIRVWLTEERHPYDSWWFIKMPMCQNGFGCCCSCSPFRWHYTSIGIYDIWFGNMFWYVKCIAFVTSMWWHRNTAWFQSQAIIFSTKTISSEWKCISLQLHFDWAFKCLLCMNKIQITSHYVGINNRPAWI